MSAAAWANGHGGQMPTAVPAGKSRYAPEAGSSSRGPFRPKPLKKAGNANILVIARFDLMREASMAPLLLKVRA